MIDPQAMTDSQRGAKGWLADLEHAEKYFSTWLRRADKIRKLYRDHDDETNRKTRRFAMLWANTEILKPTIYSRAPKPQVSRRWKDRDPAGRVASEILERCLTFEQERQGAHAVFKQVRDDHLLSGRGTVKVRYSADVQGDQVRDERVELDFVHHKDFLHGIAPVWQLVPWVAFRALKDKAEFKARWPNIDVSRVAFDHKPQDDEGKKVAPEAKCEIWEIWDKRARKVHFVTAGYDDMLETRDPFVTLDDFWPCPPPVYATMTPEQLIPVPDYIYYQDQSEEINDLTARIARLTDALKVVGFYPGGAGQVSSAIEKALRPGTENMMIAIDNWAAFGERGGGNAIVYLPIRDIADTIVRCIELRAQLIQDVYQVTGISDIVRGQTDPNETLGAQQLKSQWGSIRVQERKEDFQRFCADVTRIEGEIIAERFDPQRMMAISGLKPNPENPEEIQRFQEAVALLRDERTRGFRIDIETDSTVQPDEDAEKQRRVELTTTVGAFLQQGMEVAQAQPGLVPVMGEILLFLVRGFRAGRSLEDAIERAIEGMAQQAQQPQPDPEAEKAKAELQMKSEEHQMTLRAKGAELQMKGAEHQMNMQGQSMELQGQREKMALDAQAQQVKLQGLTEQNAIKAMAPAPKRGGR